MEMFGQWTRVVIFAFFGIVVLAAVRSTATSPKPTFVIEPTSVNASLNSEVVEFTCACIHCTTQLWIVDDQWALDITERGVHVDDRKTLADGSYLYRLTLPPLEVNNNTEVFCVIHNTTANTVDTSQLAILRVQGLLGEVEDLMVTNINTSTLLVSFEEPSSLSGVPILFFSIVVITTHPKNVISTTNITNTSMYLHLDKMHICSQLELMVSGWNEVGEGQVSQASPVLYDVPSALNADSITTDLQYQESMLAVELEFEINDSCTGKAPDSVMLNISSMKSSQLITTEWCLLPKSEDYNLSCIFPLHFAETGISQKPLVRISLSQLLQTNHHYLLSVILGNQAGNIPSTHPTSISTYDVQKGYVHISVLDSVCIVCVVVPGSTMKTCLAAFTDISTGRGIEVVIPGPTFTDCVELPSGRYNVEFRDVNPSGDIEMGVAYHIQTTVQVNPTSPPSTVSVSATATTSGQSSESVLVFPIVLVGSGILITFLVIVVIVLVILLQLFKKREGKLPEEKQEEKANESNPVHHSPIVIEEFGNIGSEPKHIYDNINELTAKRRPSRIVRPTNIPIPPSPLRMQECPAYGELPRNQQNLPTQYTEQTTQDVVSDV